MRRVDLVIFLSIVFLCAAVTARADDCGDTTKPVVHTTSNPASSAPSNAISSDTGKVTIPDTTNSGSADTTKPVSTNAAKPAFHDTADYAGYYTWNDFVEIWPFDMTSFKVNGDPVMCDVNVKFQVLESALDHNGVDTDLIVKFLYYLDDEPKFLGIKTNKPKITNDVYFYRYNFKDGPAAFNSLDATTIKRRQLGSHQLYFLLKGKSIFRAHAVKVPYQRKTIIKGGLGFGVLNYPFKFRIQPHINDFSGSFNVGAAVAYTYRHDSTSKWSFSHILGLGISSVTLDKASVYTTDTAGLSSTNSFSALTLSYGFMVQYDKVQVGFFIGWDRISNLNNSTYGWKYQGNPWISVGIGLSIFSTSSTTSQTQGDTQSAK